MVITNAVVHSGSADLYSASEYPTLTTSMLNDMASIYQESKSHLSSIYNVCVDSITDSVRNFKNSGLGRKLELFKHKLDNVVGKNTLRDLINPNDVFIPPPNMMKYMDLNPLLSSAVSKGVIERYDESRLFRHHPDLPMELNPLYQKANDGMLQIEDEEEVFNMYANNYDAEPDEELTFNQQVVIKQAHEYMKLLYDEGYNPYSEFGDKL